MTGEIIIFQQAQKPPVDPALLAAIENVSSEALQCVSGDPDQERKVAEVLNHVKEIAKSDGRAEALKYMAQVYHSA